MDTLCNALHRFDTRSENNNSNNINGCQMDHLYRSNQHEDHHHHPVEEDYFDGVFKYLQEMLMEEDDNFQDCLALQAAERSFYEALNENPAPIPDSPNRSLANTSNSSGNILEKCFNSPIDIFAEICPPVINEDYHALHNILPCSHDDLVDPAQTRPHSEVEFGEGRVHAGIPSIRRVDSCGKQATGSPDESSREDKNKNRAREDEGEDGRRSKQVASNTEEETEGNIEEYDNALLCPARDPNFYGESGPKKVSIKKEESLSQKPQFVAPSTGKRGRPRAGSKKNAIREVVDLRELLGRCANLTANFDTFGASQTLMKIRQHSSPFGDPTERLAHCFGNALEARIAGMGTALYAALAGKRASGPEVLRAYQAYLGICPFQRMSNIFANKSIAKITSNAKMVHIIDFGIFYGFQWPCLLHGISLRPGGPPKLRITGIDLPQPGFRPAERIEETGRRLASYAERFNVPFEFHSIGKRWEEITEQDLMIDPDEMLIVNCVYRMRNVADEISLTGTSASSSSISSPRDWVMDLIKKLNPSLFVHGILNGNYGVPFFETRFKEALYHFSSVFDMLEATMPRDDPDRGMFEKEVLGRDVMNVVACEGSERVERPDGYKKWSARNARAGFRPVPLDHELMREVKVKTRLSYHKEFLVDEHENWMLQGWKGRILYALSCWQPSKGEDMLM